MIRRSFTATLLNLVANDPEVRPWLGGANPGEAIDLTEAVANTNNITLEGAGGGFFLQLLTPGTYELHTIFAKAARGKPMVEAARQMFRYVFAQTEALEILTKCPDNNDGARWLSSAMGFRERFRREDSWAPGVGISYRVLSIDDWFIRDREALRAGKEFHEILQAARVAEAMPTQFSDHADDEAHDRAAGAALLMARSGQTAKAVVFYNRWALFAGYLPIEIVGPGVVDIQDAIVAVQGERPEVLHLR